jgi:hypothetical protein
MKSQLKQISSVCETMRVAGTSGRWQEEDRAHLVLTEMKKGTKKEDVKRGANPRNYSAFLKGDL